MRIPFHTEKNVLCVTPDLARKWTSWNHWSKNSQTEFLCWQVTNASKQCDWFCTTITSPVTIDTAVVDATTNYYFSAILLFFVVFSYNFGGLWLLFIIYI